MYILSPTEVEVKKPSLTITIPKKGAKVTANGLVELTCKSDTAGVHYTIFKNDKPQTFWFRAGVLTMSFRLIFNYQILSVGCQ